jgi:hypothetical protein
MRSLHLVHSSYSSHIKKLQAAFCGLSNHAEKILPTSAKQRLSTDSFTLVCAKLEKLENKVCTNMVRFRATKTTSGFCSESYIKSGVGG